MTSEEWIAANKELEQAHFRKPEGVPREWLDKIPEHLQHFLAGPPPILVPPKEVVVNAEAH